MERPWVIAGAVMFALVMHAGCANDDGSDIVATLDEPDAGPPPPTFTDPPAPDGGADGGVEIGAPSTLLCMDTECPSPYATCPASGGRLAFKCETNLMTDDANCGACGNRCPVVPEQFGMATHCVAGACKRECLSDDRNVYADCNGIVDDGCEVRISHDPDNCGACGNKCPAGVGCFEGKCGCPSGQIDCNGACIDASSNAFHCGACNNRCTAPPTPPPPNMEYGCANGECGQLRCRNLGAQQWRDCNDDIETDGCETNVASDVNNCGACGKKCAPGQQCLRDRNGIPFCGCEPNEAMCGSGTNLSCADLTNDPANCGACGRACPGRIANGQPVCNKGYCAFECDPGWADCDGDVTNGCETNLMVNGANCGACGNRCDIGAGQPCVDGECLMKEWDGGGAAMNRRTKRDLPGARESAPKRTSRALTTVRPSGLLRASALGLFALGPLYVACAEADEPGARDHEPTVIPDAQAEDAPDGGAHDATDAGCDASSVDCPPPPPETSDADFSPVDTDIDGRLAFAAIWGTSAADIWAVGTGGAIAHYDGAKWSLTPSGTKQSLQAIWGSSRDDVWVTSTPGVILRGALGGASPSWEIVSPPLADYATVTASRGKLVSTVWGWSKDDVLFGGEAFAPRTADPPQIQWRASDSGFVPISGCVRNGSCPTVRSIWGTGPSHIWAVGAAGHTRHASAIDEAGAPEWTELDSQTTSELLSVWGAGGGEVWTVGALGTIRRFTTGASEWEKIPSPTTSTLRSIWGSSASDVWAVGDHGTILHYDGASWTHASVALPAGDEPNLNGVWGSGPNDVWVVGDGIFLHFTGPKDGPQGK